MLLNPDYMRAALPDRLPTDNYVEPGGMPDSIREREDLRASFLWTNALLQAVRRTYAWLIPGDTMVSVGFMEGAPAISKVSSGIYSAGPFSFGVHFRSLLSPFPLGPPVLGRIEVDGFSFPVISSWSPPELHRPPDPWNGTASCWIAERTKNKSWEFGVLTCKHVLKGAHLGTKVQLLHQGKQVMNSVLVDQTRDTIDAVVLAIDPNDWPTSLTPLRVAHPLCGGMQIQMGRMSGSILRVNDHSFYQGDMMALQICTDIYGSPGNSGTLLTNDRMTEGYGIYLGSIPSAYGQREGLHQLLAQICAYFELEPYT